MNRSRHRISLALLSLLVASASACGSDDKNNADSDGGLIADAGPLIADAEIIPLAYYPVGGAVVDYFADDTPVANAMVSTEGLRPQVTATANGEGVFTMDILFNSLLYISTTASGYVLSRNSPLQMLETAIQRNQFVASDIGIARQYTGAGVTAVAGNGVVLIDLLTTEELPIIGINASELTLTAISAPGTPVGTAYFVDPVTQDLSASITSSVVDTNNKSRAGFLNVPPGEYNVNVILPSSAGIQTIFVIVPPDGASFVHSSINGDGRGSPNIVLDPSSPLGFTEDIYPILQTVARGGDGCAACHDTTHSLPFVNGAEETLALLNMDATDPVGVPRINLASPDESPFLLNPVYEDVPNHPNVFWTVNSNHYGGVLGWIEQGAALFREDAVLP